LQRLFQKNWMPWVHGDAFMLVINTEPLMVAAADMQSGRCRVIHRGPQYFAKKTELLGGEGRRNCHNM
jgi:hypothetical protein